MLSKINISKSITVQPKSCNSSKFYQNFKHIIYILILFGFHYITLPNTNRFFDTLLKIYCILLSVITSVVMLQYVSLNNSPYIFVVIEYILAVLILCFSKKSHRVCFFRQMEEIDKELNVKDDYYADLSKLAVRALSVILLTRILYSASLCLCFELYCAKHPFAVGITSFILMATDINQVPRVIVFAFVRYRMYMLRVSMMKTFNINSVTVTNDDKLVYVLRNYRRIYRKIIDTVDDVSRLMNPLFILSLMSCFPKIMTLIYNILKLNIQGISLFYLMILGVESLQWGLITCLPGIVMEKTYAEVDKIKLFLLHQYEDTHDQVQRTEIKEFLYYIEKRPFQYNIWRLIRVDVSLPICLLNLCTTYLIVLIQFTHLFE